MSGNVGSFDRAYILNEGQILEEGTPEKELLKAKGEGDLFGRRVSS